MRKNYILDTSVLAHNPSAYLDFKNSDVTLPITVLEELDKLKKGHDVVAKNARIFCRTLDVLTRTAEAHKGIKIDSGIVLKVDAVSRRAISGDQDYGDNRILASAQHFNKVKNRSTVLVSRDINLRIRARFYGIAAQDYSKEKPEGLEMFSGFREIASIPLGVKLSETGSVQLSELPEEHRDMLPNECVNFVEDDGQGISIGRLVGSKIQKIDSNSAQAFDLGPRNREQAFALNMLLDPKIHLVSLVGKAGCGKSIVAIAAALEMVLNKKKYDKFIVYRPIQPVGNDIGYLPGSKEEKLEPWMGAVMDSFEVLFGGKSKERWQSMVEMYCEKGKIEMNAITHIRGRSIPNAFIMIDEAQQIGKEEMKTILTRAGEGTKIVLTGDVEQIDAKHLDAQNNGLAYVLEKFKKYDMAGHITFTKGERSPLATLASEIL